MGKNKAEIMADVYLKMQHYNESARVVDNEGKVVEKRYFDYIGGEVEHTELIARKYAEIMNLLGIPVNDDNRNTPYRVAKALIEMTENVGKEEKELIEQCTTFENKNKGNVALEQDEIEFSSMCSHHHLPFFGKVKISYMPNECIIGLSKFNRVVNFFAKKPQVQEDFTAEIGQFLVDILDPKYLDVEVYDCTHTCMCSRGVRSLATTKSKYRYEKKTELY